MSHTNATPNYALPQFLTTDKPAWLTDINGAFSNIDTGINTAKTTADSAASTATTADTKATTAGTTATNADNKANGAIASLADAFSTSSTYSVGDVVIYNSLMYICTVAVTVPGAWTGSNNWARTTADDLIVKTAADMPMSPTDPTTVNAAISGIVESGSNSDGYYVKFADGTMICTKSLDLGLSANLWNTWGSAYESPFMNFGNWPAAFISKPVATLAVGGAGVWYYNYRDITATAAGQSRVCRPSPPSDMTITFEIIGIGRWK